MTREEAIKYLNEFIFFKKISNTTEDEAVKCFKLAVDALQQQPSEEEKVIRISKGTLKARTGKYVIYDVEWLKTHFNTTEAKIYGQPNEDCISRKAVFEGLKSIAKAKSKSDAQKSLMGRVMFFTEHLPSVTPQPKIGHWIGDKGTTVYVNSEGNVTESVNCSECGEWLTGSDEYICGARYCPSCGIKMQEIKK